MRRSSRVLTDPWGGPCRAVGKFGDYDVVDAAKENVELGEMTDEEKDAAEAAKEELKATTEYLKSELGSKVDKVSVSTRLTTSPSALVQPQWGMSPQMQRFMKAQAAAAGQDDMMMGGMASNLEINPDHEAVTKLKSMLGTCPKRLTTSRPPQPQAQVTKPL